MNIATKISTVILCSGALLACSQNTTQGTFKGAAAGSAGAGMLGALTDLIVDGKVNSYNLQRNMTAGAIAGGVGGGISAHKKEQAQAAEKTVIEPNKPQYNFSPFVNESITELVQCRHTEAFRLALNSAQDNSANEQEVSIALQALIDNDRNNSQGVELAVARYVEISDNITTLDAAMAELQILQQKLYNERRAQGLAPKCTP